MYSLVFGYKSLQIYVRFIFEHGQFILIFLCLILSGHLPIRESDILEPSTIIELGLIHE